MVKLQVEAQYGNDNWPEVHQKHLENIEHETRRAGIPVLIFHLQFIVHDTVS